MVIFNSVTEPEGRFFPLRKSVSVKMPVGKHTSEREPVIFNAPQTGKDDKLSCNIVNTLQSYTKFPVSTIFQMIQVSVMKLKHTHQLTQGAVKNNICHFQQNSTFFFTYCISC